MDPIQGCVAVLPARGKECLGGEPVIHRDDDGVDLGGEVLIACTFYDERMPAWRDRLDQGRRRLRGRATGSAASDITE